MIKVSNVALALNQWYKYKGAECRVTGLSGDSAVMVVVVGTPIGTNNPACEFLVPKSHLVNDCLVRYQGLPGYELAHGYEYREFDNGADTLGWEFLPNNERVFWERSAGQAAANVYLYRRKLVATPEPKVKIIYDAEVSSSKWHQLKCGNCLKWWVMEDMHESNVLYCPHCGKQNTVTV